MTLKELAALAGVTPSTVSRVLNDPSGAATKWASPTTAQKIIDLAEETGYAKNPHAASLRTKRSGIIGAVLPLMHDYVLAAIYAGIDEVAIEKGYFAMVTHSLDQPELRSARITQLLDRRVDGILLGDAHLEDPTVEKLQARGFPFVLVNRTSGTAICATSDDYRGGYLMAEHFVKQGYDSIAILAANKDVSTSVNRESGFRDGLRELGFDMSKVTTEYSGFSVENGAETMTRILDSGQRPRAVFALNDFSAIGAIGAIRSRGLSIPTDIAIAGYNGTPLASGIGLTTINAPLHEMGREAARLLDRMLRKEEVESVVLPVELVVRETA
ncbi:MAG: LacI family DNA-binding transcriptional regulator [Gulosibacter sp.]|uniref:LacI family DNA-binding transcriptional regulator n=1 Tax=Gulosibacter sp. TaxID=2817531 RepID=UPI003F921C7F